MQKKDKSKYTKTIKCIVMTRDLNFKKFKFAKTKQEEKKSILMCPHNIKMERAILSYDVASIKKTLPFTWRRKPWTKKLQL